MKRPYTPGFCPAFVRAEGRRPPLWPRLGYGVSYGVGNVLLALWGPVVIVLMGGSLR